MPRNILESTEDSGWLDHPQSPNESSLQEQRNDLGRLQEYVMVLYAKGLSNQEISFVLLKRHGILLSKEAIGDMLERTMPGFIGWQGRWLHPVYEQVYMVGLAVKMKHGYRSRDKRVFVPLGFRPDGSMEALGLWIVQKPDGPFWKTLLSELQARGLQDIHCVTCEEFEALLTEIKEAFPTAKIALCGAYPWAQGLELPMAAAKQKLSQHERRIAGNRLFFANSAGHLHATLQKAARPNSPFSNDDAALKALFWRVMEWKASAQQQGNSMQPSDDGIPLAFWL